MELCVPVFNFECLGSITLALSALPTTSHPPRLDIGYPHSDASLRASKLTLALLLACLMLESKMATKRLSTTKLHLRKALDALSATLCHNVARNGKPLRSRVA